MRRALIISFALLSLNRANRDRVKLSLRRLAVVSSQWLLNRVAPKLELQNGTVVVFAPHQDDETLGCGAMIARRRQDGLPVHVVFLTDGSASHPNHPNYSSEKMAAIRRAEAQRALATLGVESNCIYFIDAPDGALSTLCPAERNRVLQCISTIIGANDPVRVFVPFHRDGSSEHDAAFILITEALATLRGSCEIWQYPIWAWWNPTLLARLLVHFRRAARLPTEDYSAPKHAAIRHYRSQVQPLAPNPDPYLPDAFQRVFLGPTEYFFRHRT